MLSATQAAVINNKIALQLKSVGSTECPPSTNNTESYAWDYYIANKIEQYGKAAKKTAVKNAIKNGVMFDHEKEPREPTDGETVDIYTGDVIRISLAVKQPSVSVSGQELYESLLKSLPEHKSVIEDAYVAAHKSARPAHTFTATLLSD